MRRNRSEKVFYYTRQGFYNKCLSELRETEERVAWLLWHHVVARNNDHVLVLIYWQTFDGLGDSINLDNIMTLTYFENIRRCRQKIQNTLNLYLPTDEEVRKARKIKEEAYRTWVYNNEQDVLSGMGQKPV